jgi:hypothetical protein
LRPALAITIVLAARSAAAQDEPAPPAPTRVDCRSLYRACLDARDPDRMPLGGDSFSRGRARAEQRRVRERIVGALLEVEVPANAFAFEEYDFDGESLSVDTERNLRLWGGRIDLFPSGGDALAFPLAPDRARDVVERHRRREVKLRIGFLLGHDDPDADPCLLRPGVPPIVKADVAYMELADVAGHVLAREDTARLADAHTLAPDTSGAAASVRVTVAPPTITGDRAVAAAVEADFAGGASERLAAAIQPCVRADGPVGTVVVDLALEGGHASDVRIEVDSLHEDTMSACIRDAVAAWAFPAAGHHARARVSVPVMITRE